MNVQDGTMVTMAITLHTEPPGMHCHYNWQGYLCGGDCMAMILCTVIFKRLSHACTYAH